MSVDVPFVGPNNSSLNGTQGLILMNRPTFYQAGITTSPPVMLKLVLADPTTGSFDSTATVKIMRSSMVPWAAPEEEYIKQQQQHYAALVGAMQREESSRSVLSSIASSAKSLLSGDWSKVVDDMKTSLEGFTSKLIPMQFLSYDVSLGDLPTGPSRMTVGKGTYRYGIVAPPAPRTRTMTRLEAKATILGVIGKPKFENPTSVVRIDSASTTSCEGTNAYLRVKQQQDGVADPSKIDCAFAIVELQFRPTMLPWWIPPLLANLRCQKTGASIHINTDGAGRGAPLDDCAQTFPDSLLFPLVEMTSASVSLGGADTSMGRLSAVEIRHTLKELGFDWVLDDLEDLRRKAESEQLTAQDVARAESVAQVSRQYTQQLSEMLETRLTHSDAIDLGDFLHYVTLEYYTHIREHWIKAAPTGKVAEERATITVDTTSMLPAQRKSIHTGLENAVKEVKERSRSEKRIPNVNHNYEEYLKKLLQNPRLEQFIRERDLNKFLQELPRPSKVMGP